MKRALVVFAVIFMTGTAAFAQKKEIQVLTEEITRLNLRIDSLEKVCVANKVVTEQMEKMVSAYGKLEASYTTLQNSLTEQQKSFNEQQKSLGDQKAINEKLNANLEAHIATVNKLLEKVDSLTAKLNQNDNSAKGAASEYQYVSNLCNGLAAVRIGACFGYVNKAGEVVIPAEYDEVKNFENNYAIVRKNDKWGIIDKTGKVTVECKYDDIILFNNDIYKVKSNNNYGLVKTNGQIVQSVKYVAIRDLIEERAGIRLGDEWGYLNQNGALVISIQYGNYDSFTNGKAYVSYANGDDMFYIDKNGRRQY